MTPTVRVGDHWEPDMRASGETLQDALALAS
ncbi:hypothetical protein D9619_007688 [Psilocybe cf. subviscida]|uniref:Uncharacterized protein n=1 Tax=Psilocybe cf. subviscida TaxID=2480587 RepID=A0A8H5ESM2_9AGAR|nr:hypothetical protein D9619_007688 [Psilocybe cf. subviscida]